MNYDRVFFFIVAGVAILSAVFTVTRRNPVKSVLFLIVNFFCLALLYLSLHAQFIAILQILVYAGAIMVLFLFVIMLLNLGDERALTEKVTVQRILGLVFGGVILVQLVFFFSATGLTPLPEPGGDFGSVESIGRALFRDYLIPFEVTSILLLAALVGVIVMAKKKLH